MAKSDLSIDLLGTVVTISTDEEEGYLKKLLDKYKRTVENVHQKSGLKDPLKVAVLTGFLLSDELEKAGAKAERSSEERNTSEQSSETESPLSEESSEAELITLGMISRLDAALVVSSDSEKSQDKKTVAEIFKLQNSVKNYDWGSPDWIPSLIGEENKNRVPWAELWMGVNPLAPSRVLLPEEHTPDINPFLSELIAQEKEFYLGERTARKYGTIPFLFKVLAAARPLSIQAHPNREQAELGFERENRAGIALDSPVRNYRNSSHKPEVICALEPFTALCGFRKVKEIIFLIEILSLCSEGETKAAFDDLLSALRLETENPYRAFLSSLFGMGYSARGALGPFIEAQMPMLERDFPEYKEVWEMISGLANQYSGDPGILSPLYLNIIKLTPGEAMYLPAGVFHSYVYGLGMELMADSDNVLRGGLTSKHVDPEELERVLNFSEYIPEILKIQDPAPGWFRYPTPTEEFSLSVMSSQGDAIPYPETEASIVFFTNGSATVSVPGNSSEMVLLKGDSVFIPAGQKGNLVFYGTFTAFSASVPCASL